MVLKRRIRLKNVSFFFIYLVFFIILVFSLFNIFLWIKNNQQNNKVKEEIMDDIPVIVKKDEKEIYIETDLKKLKEINHDTVGWVQVPNTNINYPVVQTNDNDYYLSRNFYKENNEAGWIFLDYRNASDGSDHNTIMYGHNRLDHSMFGTLQKALNKNWLSSNKYVFFNTFESNNTYVIFSVYSINAADFVADTSFDSDEAYLQYLNTLKNRSIIDLGVDVSSDDKIITLYTCALNNIDRTIVHAKLVQSIPVS